MINQSKTFAKHSPERHSLLSNILTLSYLLLTFLNFFMFLLRNWNWVVINQSKTFAKHSPERHSLLSNILTLSYLLLTFLNFSYRRRHSLRCNIRPKGIRATHISCFATLVLRQLLLEFIVYEKHNQSKDNRRNNQYRIH